MLVNWLIDLIGDTKNYSVAMESLLGKFGIIEIILFQKYWLQFFFITLAIILKVVVVCT